MTTVTRPLKTMNHLICFTRYPRSMMDRNEVIKLGQMDYIKSNTYRAQNVDTNSVLDNGAVQRNFFKCNEVGLASSANAWAYFGFSNMPVVLAEQQSRFVHCLGFRFYFRQDIAASNIFQKIVRYSSTNQNGTSPQLIDFLELDFNNGLLRTVARPGFPSVTVTVLPRQTWVYIEIVREWNGTPGAGGNNPGNGGTIKFYINGTLVKSLLPTQVPHFQNKDIGAKWTVNFGQMNKAGAYQREWRMADIYSYFHRNVPNSTDIKRLGPVKIIRAPITSVESIDLEPEELNNLKTKWNNNQDATLSSFVGFNQNFQVSNSLYFHPTNPKPIKAISHITYGMNHQMDLNPYLKKHALSIMADDETTHSDVNFIPYDTANTTPYVMAYREAFMGKLDDDLSAQTNNYHTSVSIED